MELPDGVHSFPQTLEQDGTEKTISPAAVETPKGVVLIDTGYPGLVDQTGDNLAAAGFDWDDVASVVLTHHDTDHAGSLSAIVDRTDGVVYAHERAAPFIDGREEPIKSPDGERYPAVDVDIELVDGVSFRTAAGPMDVVFTPGHAPGHVSLHFPEAGLLVAADALTSDGTTLQGPKEQYTPDMERALESAGSLAQLEFDRTLCYHGGFVAEGTDRVGELGGSLQ